MYSSLSDIQVVHTKCILSIVIIFLIFSLIVNQKYCLNCKVRIHYIRITEKFKIQNISDYRVVPHQPIIVVMNSMHSTIIRNGMFIPKIELCQQCCALNLLSQGQKINCEVIVGQVSTWGPCRSLARSFGPGAEQHFH